MDRAKLHKLDHVAHGIIRLEKLFESISSNFNNEIEMLKGWVRDQIAPIRAELDSIQLIENEPSEPNVTDDDLLKNVNQLEELLQTRKMNKNIRKLRSALRKAMSALKVNSSSISVIEGGEVVPPSLPSTSGSSERQEGSLMPPSQPSVIEEVPYVPLNSKKRISAEKKYKCKHCKKRFKTKSARTVHIGNHHQKKQARLPFKCNETGCGHRFKTEKGLESHRNERHIGLKCSMCDDVFYKKTGLKSHLESKHLRCGYKNCGLQFITKPGLMSHKKKCAINRRGM